MSDKSAIQATFSDFRIVKSRKIAQLVCEVPLEQADAALATLGGLPQPAAERWVALARLNPDGPVYEGMLKSDFQRKMLSARKAKPDPKERQKWEDLGLSMRAAIICSKPGFWRFLNGVFGREIFDEQEAANFVRQRCGVNSRSALNLDPVAAAKWQELEARYMLWLRDPQHA